MIESSEATGGDRPEEGLVERLGNAHAVFVASLIFERSYWIAGDIEVAINLPKPFFDRF